MKPSVKSPVESALVAALVAACLLWLLISAGTAEEVDNARVALLAIGMAISLIAHVVYLCVALQRDGRAPLPWLAGMLLLPPVVSVVAVVLLVTRDEEPAGG